MEETYKVKIGQFEGPLDLLLDLIEKRKMHIGDVSLVAVTDDYISFVKNMDSEAIGNIAHFVLVASTLLLIKSKSLLPNLSLTTEEKADIENLEERLRTHQRVKELSEHVKEKFGKKMIFAKEERKNIPVVFSPDESVTLASMLSSIRFAITNLPIKELIPKAVVKKIVSLEETMDNLIHRIKSSFKLGFREFSQFEKAEKVLVIVSFLAMLELVKQGTIAVSQQSNFGDIEMETNEIGVPSYGQI